VREKYCLFVHAALKDLFALVVAQIETSVSCRNTPSRAVPHVSLQPVLSCPALLSVSKLYEFYTCCTNYYSYIEAEGLRFVFLFLFVLVCISDSACAQRRTPETPEGVMSVGVGGTVWSPSPKATFGPFETEQQHLFCVSSFSKKKKLFCVSFPVHRTACFPHLSALRSDPTASPPSVFALRCCRTSRGVRLLRVPGPSAHCSLLSARSSRVGKF
jgi:hypothetical protein